MKLLKFIERKSAEFPQKLYLSKIKYAEEKAIRDKKAIYANIKWSGKQQKEFDDFWIKNYGKKIKPWWNKLYERFNGVYHYDYFPEMLYTTKLEPILNSFEDCKAIENKALIEFIYGQVENVRIPKTYLACCNGVYRNSDRSIVSFDEAKKTLSDIGECVIKPTVETGSGKGVRFLNIKNGKDITKNEAIGDILKNYKKDFIVQEAIKSSKEFMKLYPHAVNTIRLTSYIADGRVGFCPIALRIGANGSKLDNIHSGGIGVRIYHDGKLDAKGYQLGYGNKSVTYSAHPDTGTVFKDFYACDIQKVMSVARDLHSITPNVGIISWDFTIDENDNVVLIEANCRDQGVWFPQIVCESSLFGDDTAYMLNLIREK